MPDFDPDSPAVVQGMYQMAHDIAATDNVPHYKNAQGRGRRDPELGLNMAFYNKAVKDERKSKLGFHYVFNTTLLGEDGKYPEAAKQFNEDGTPMMVDCDCEEEYVLRGSKQASTLARVVMERTKQGLHCTPPKARPIFVDEVWIHIWIPGEQRNEVDTRAIVIDDDEYADTHPGTETSAAHNLKYPRHWEDFKKRQNKSLEGAAIIGTPLRELAKENVRVLKPSQVAAFEAGNVRTVEQLLAMSDSNAQGIMGWSTIKQAVLAWHEQHAASAPGEAMEELERRHQAEMETMRQQNEEMQTRLKVLENQRLYGVQPPAPVAPPMDAERPSRQKKARGQAVGRSA